MADLKLLRDTGDANLDRVQQNVKAALAGTLSKVPAPTVETTTKSQTLNDATDYLFVNANLAPVNIALPSTRQKPITIVNAGNGTFHVTFTGTIVNGGKLIANGAAYTLMPTPNGYYFTAIYVP